MNLFPLPPPTERLAFRCFDSADAEDLAFILGDPEVMRFSIRGVQSREQIEVWIQERLDQYRLNGPAQYAVIDRQTRRLIGYCGYLPYEGQVELSYRFRRECWGKGFGYEAARQVVAFGFGPLGLKQILGFVDKDNTASARILERIGMRYIEDTEYRGLPMRRYRVCAGDL